MWVQPDVRDEIVDYVKYWNNRTEIPLGRLLAMASIPSSKFYAWRRRYGRPNFHNAAAPRDWWLEPWEVAAIRDYKRAHPLDGYRRLTYMMLDENIVAVAPTTTFRVLRAAGLLHRTTNKASLKGTGFHQPTAPHRHWHIDISYINLLGTFFYLTSVIDGYSRYIVHHECAPPWKNTTSRSPYSGRWRNFRENNPASSATTAASSSAANSRDTSNRWD